jgi:hypothetical protein
MDPLLFIAMKTIILTAFAILTIQTDLAAKNPAMLHSSKGYWVVEEHRNTHKTVQIVKYYSPAHQLLRQDTVIGKAIDLKSRRCLIKLNRRA